MYREEEILFQALKTVLEFEDDIENIDITADMINDFMNLSLIYDELFISKYFSCIHDLREVFKCLCLYYLSNGKNINSYTYNFLINNKFNDLYDLFYNSSSFGCELLKNFYDCSLFNPIKLDLNNKEFEQFDYTKKFLFYNDYARSCIEKYYESVIKNGGNNDNAVNNIIDALKNDICSDDKNLNYINENRNLILRLILTDLYEDICMNNYCISNEELDAYDSMVVNIVESGKNSFKFDDDILVYLITYYIELLYDPNRRTINRAALDSRKRNLIKRLNPLYMYERVSQ